jgi:hypothetical protein
MYSGEYTTEGLLLTAAIALTIRICDQRGPFSLLMGEHSYSAVLQIRRRFDHTLRRRHRQSGLTGPDARKSFQPYHPYQPTYFTLSSRPPSISSSSQPQHPLIFYPPTLIPPGSHPQILIQGTPVCSYAVTWYAAFRALMNAPTARQIGVFFTLLSNSLLDGCIDRVTHHGPELSSSTHTNRKSNIGPD